MRVKVILLCLFCSIYGWATNTTTATIHKKKQIQIKVKVIGQVNHIEVYHIKRVII